MKEQNGDSGSFGFFMGKTFKNTSDVHGKLMVFLRSRKDPTRTLPSKWARQCPFWKSPSFLRRRVVKTCMRRQTICLTITPQTRFVRWGMCYFIFLFYHSQNKHVRPPCKGKRVLVVLYIRFRFRYGRPVGCFVRCPNFGSGMYQR